MQPVRDWHWRVIAGNLPRCVSSSISAAAGEV